MYILNSECQAGADGAVRRLDVPAHDLTHQCDGHRTDAARRRLVCRCRVQGEGYTTAMTFFFRVIPVDLLSLRLLDGASLTLSDTQPSAA